MSQPRPSTTRELRAQLGMTSTHSVGSRIGDDGTLIPTTRTVVSGGGRGTNIWGMVVLVLGDEERAVLAVQPCDQATWDDMAPRMKKTGMKKVRDDQITKGNWDASEAQLIVSGGRVTEVVLHHGRHKRSRLYPAPAPEVTPRWLDAAADRRPLFVLLAPGVLDNAPADGVVMKGAEAENHYEWALFESSSSGHLLAGTATTSLEA